MVTREFKVCYGYAYNGEPGRRPDGWNPGGDMDFLLDGEIHVVESLDGLNVVVFKDDPNHYPWNLQKTVHLFDEFPPQ